MLNADFASVQGGAAAAVMAGFFGRDRMNFSVCSITLPTADNRCGGSAPVLHRFASFSQAAAENGESRILVGYHFRKAVTDGITHGPEIGGWAVATSLRPCPS